MPITDEQHQALLDSLATLPRTKAALRAFFTTVADLTEDETIKVLQAICGMHGLALTTPDAVAERYDAPIVRDISERYKEVLRRGEARRRRAEMQAVPDPEPSDEG